jgi:nucleoid-associated protein YgaU
MSDRTEPFEPYEPEPAYEWDFDPEPHQRPKVLWGRLAALALLLLAVFFAGRACAPEGIAAEDYEQARNRIEVLEGQNDDLRNALAAEKAAEPSPEPTESPTADAGGGDDAQPVEGEDYIVQSGDSLAGLSLEFYDDASYADELAQVNGLPPDSFLEVGQELFIPDEPPTD